MNIQPIKMAPKEARERARVYGKAVALAVASRVRDADSPLARVIHKTDQEREDEALRKAYSALARGQDVIHLPTVMRQAGLTVDTFLPRLAIVRADAQRVEMDVRMSSVRFLNPLYRHLKDRRTVVPGSAFPAELRDFEWRRRSKLPFADNVSALCPQIPPHLRPSRPADFYLLWEPVWAPKPPDPDPFLVKPLGGGFFAIVAQWDMTPLEQAILEGRLG